MQANMKINGVDFTPFIIENGILQTDVERQLVEMVMLDGTLLRRSRRVRAIHVSLLTLRDEYYKVVSDALKADRVSVTYTDRDNGEVRNRMFYVMERTAAVKRVSGGNTYWSGGSFRLEVV